MHFCLGLLAVLMATAAPQAEPSSMDFTMAKPPGPHCPLSAEQLKEVASYRAGQPLVGTHFFYWHDIESKAHFIDYDGTDALTDHPTRSDGYSYKSAAWWKRELLDVMAAGIDFILPVYWGCPGDYDSWSFAGLPPLVQAWEDLVREGRQPPHMGLFYDTSTLRRNPRGWHVDLSTDAGKYVYLDLDDTFMFDEESVTLLAEIEYLDGGFGSFTLQYDSIDPGASVREGAFKPLGKSVACGDTGKWKTAKLNINGGRFADRCNGGDLRLAVTGGDLVLRRITATRGPLPGKDGGRQRHGP